jgi:hypothetical protein
MGDINTLSEDKNTPFSGVLEEATEAIRINIADMIYVLDIQHKNPHIDRVLARYGISNSMLDRIRKALEKGRWKVLV